MQMHVSKVNRESQMKTLKPNENFEYKGCEAEVHDILVAINYSWMTHSERQKHKFVMFE